MMEFDVAKTSAANGNSPVQAGVDDVKRIGEMAEEYGVTLRTLRFYEDKGLLNPIRDGNARLYTRKDQARLKLILLGRKVGFSLRDVKQMMDLYDPAGANTRQLRVALEKSDKQMGRLVAQRVALEEAIAALSSAMDAVRQKLARRRPTGPRGAERQPTGCFVTRPRAGFLFLGNLGTPSTATGAVPGKQVGLASQESTESLLTFA